MRVLGALASARVEYVLVGGVAIGLHGFERATNDIDLFVRTDEANIERLREALRSVFDDPSIAEISADDLAGEYPTVRYGPPEGDYFIDLLGRLGSEIKYEDLEFEITEIEGVPIRLATLEDRTAWLWNTAVEPRFDSIRDQPRFRELVERYGLHA